VGGQKIKFVLAVIWKTVDRKNEGKLEAKEVVKKG